MSNNNSSIAAAQTALSGLILGAGGPEASIFQVRWVGPFNPAQAQFRQAAAEDAYRVATMNPGVSQQVTLDEQNLLAASDPAWWVIVG